MNYSTTKPTKWPVRPAKTRTILGIRPDRSESSLPHEETLAPQLRIVHTANTLIRLSRCVGWSESSLGAQCHFVIPRHSSNRLSVRPSVRLSVRPSVSASSPDSNLSSFWPIFFKLCMDIDIGKEWFGIVNGLNSFINNIDMPLDWCKNVFFLNIFRTNGRILINICTFIDLQDPCRV